MSDPGDLVVIGVGNVLRGDDAAGVHVVEGLRRAGGRDASVVPAGTHLVDGGTLGLDLLRTIRDARGLVLVDAARLGGAPGTVTILRGDAILDAVGARPDAAGGAVGELVATARALGWLPGDVALVAVEAGATEAGLALSDEVAAAVGPAMDAVIGELRRMDEPGRAAPAGATADLAGTAGATA